ncbi:MAG: hypothetical protein LBQ60_15730 [Bacteroidales bacterium]|nr:hypothetical protein [Bacteroidales bacterium]
MRKIIIAFCFILFLTGETVISQNKLKIRDVEITLGKSEGVNDTNILIEVGEKESPGILKNDKEDFNRRGYHTHNGYVGLEFMIPWDEDKNLKIHYGKSNHFNIGYRYGFHPVRWYGIGYIAQYSFYNYRLKDASESLTGTANRTSKEVFRSNNLGLGVYNRFYLYAEKYYRPNSDGLYLDIGIRGDWAYGRFYKTKGNADDFSINTKYRNGYAFYPFSASVIAGIGVGWFEVMAQYRITEIFNSKVIDAKLPPVTIGIQMAFEKKKVKRNRHIKRNF